MIGNSQHFSDTKFSSKYIQFETVSSSLVQFVWILDRIGVIWKSNWLHPLPISPTFMKWFHPQFAIFVKANLHWSMVVDKSLPNDLTLNHFIQLVHKLAIQCLIGWSLIICNCCIHCNTIFAKSLLYNTIFVQLLTK